MNNIYFFGSGKLSVMMLILLLEFLGFLIQQNIGERTV